MHNKLLVSAAVLMVAGGIYATQGVGMAAGQAAPSTAKGQIEATLTDTLKSGKKAAADTLKQRKDTTDKAKKKKDEYADLIKKGGMSARVVENAEVQRGLGSAMLMSVIATLEVTRRFLGLDGQPGQAAGTRGDARWPAKQ